MELYNSRVFSGEYMSDISLKKNISVLIFLQTTRELRFDPKKFNTLGIKLAKRAKVPVIPVAVKTDVWGMGKWIKDFGRFDPSKPVRVSSESRFTSAATAKPSTAPPSSSSKPSSKPGRRQRKQFNRINRIYMI